MGESPDTASPTLKGISPDGATGMCRNDSVTVAPPSSTLTVILGTMWYGSWFLTDPTTVYVPRESKKPTVSSTSTPSPAAPAVCMPAEPAAKSSAAASPKRTTSSCRLTPCMVRRAPIKIRFLCAAAPGCARAHPGGSQRTEILVGNHARDPASDITALYLVQITDYR